MTEQQNDRQWNIPVPDPTALTTEQLLREMAALRREVDLQFDSLKSITDEQFNSVMTQLTLIERQRVEQKKDTKDAVDAALAAAKEAVKEQTTASERSIAKSETSTAEQLKQQSTTFTTAIAGVTELLSDLKERVGRIESMRIGEAGTKDRFGQNWGTVIGALGVLIAVVAVVLSAVGGVSP